MRKTLAEGWRVGAGLRNEGQAGGTGGCGDARSKVLHMHMVSKQGTASRATRHLRHAQTGYVHARMTRIDLTGLGQGDDW